MQVETDITIERSAQDVFEYIAHAECLPEYVSDFETVTVASEGDPGLDTEYRYRMKRGAEGTFRWTRFEPTSLLAWEGPPVKAGPGSMQPAGRWEIFPQGSATRVKLVMAPTPGALFRLRSPFMTAGMRKGNVAALERLKQRLESSPVA